MKKMAILTGVAVVALVALALFISSKFQKLDGGVCLDSGVRLGDLDLRQKVITNLSNYELDRVRHQDIEYLPDVLRVWIGSEITDEQIAKAVIALKNDRDPFVEDHGFRRLHPMPSGQAASLVREPFVLVTSDSVGENVSIRRVASHDIRRAEISVPTVEGYQPTLLQRMQGFGNRFYQIKSRQFSYACCLPPDAENSPVRKLVPIVHAEVGAGSVIAGQNITRVAIVSNCGQVLTYKDDGGFNQIKWTAGE